MGAASKVEAHCRNSSHSKDVAAEVSSAFLSFSSLFSSSSFSSHHRDDCSVAQCTSEYHRAEVVQEERERVGSEAPPAKTYDEETAEGEAPRGSVVLDGRTLEEEG